RRRHLSEERSRRIASAVRPYAPESCANLRTSRRRAVSPAISADRMDFFPMNRQPVLSEMTLGDLISRNARYRGKETALVFEGRRYTHEQFCQRVFRLANGLITKGIKRQERIAVLAPNCSEYLEAFGAGEVA